MRFSKSAQDSITKNIAQRAKSKAFTKDIGYVAIDHSMPCVESQTAEGNFTQSTTKDAGRKTVQLSADTLNHAKWRDKHLTLNVIDKSDNGGSPNYLPPDHPYYKVLTVQ